MGQSAEELKREIEQTRSGLSDTIDAIGDRVSPGRRIERRKNRISHGLRSAKERVMGAAGDGAHELKSSATHALDAVHEMPETVTQRTQGSALAAGAIAAGVGFLAAAMIPPSRKEQRVARQIVDRAEPVTRELATAAKETADHLREPARAAVDDLKATTTRAVHEVASSAADAAASTKDEASHP